MGEHDKNMLKSDKMVKVNITSIMPVIKDLITKTIANKKDKIKLPFLFRELTSHLFKNLRGIHI